MRSGPLAPVEVTVISVETKAISPTLYGIGTIEPRYTYKIGPTSTARLKNLEVDVGDSVNADQIIGEMESVDLEYKVHSLNAMFERAKSVLNEAQIRFVYAQNQALRYERLFADKLTSEENVTTKRQELDIAKAALNVSKEDLIRAESDLNGTIAQRTNLLLIAPVNGIVAERSAEPGSTVVAGQTVVEIIDPDSIWINVRFDQISAKGLTGDLPANIVLRSHSGQVLEGSVLRVEVKADSVTEEMLAKVVLTSIPIPLPPLGELAEVTVTMPLLKASPSIPNAALRRVNDQLGVWQISNEELHFTPVTLGANDLDGFVQVTSGVKDGDQIILYTEKALTQSSSLNVVDKISGLH
ncbi:MAG: efflux RND transporter periplasmic adaptor subunit [Glaciecola sp.]